MKRIILLIAAMVLSGLTTQVSADESDWNKVAQALGKSGSIQPGDIYKVSLPRTDLKVTVDGVTIKPALALGSWVAFKPMGTKSMLMGDLVLTGTEIPVVMSRLLDNSIDVTAIHNHLLRSQPAIYYMHVGAEGDPIKIAHALHEALSASATPFAPPASTTQSADIDLDTKALDATLGYKGKVAGGVYQFSIPRADITRDDSMEIPPSMGMALGINFEPTGSGKAAIAGDLVLLSKEVNPVLHALHDHGIEITALHSHMINDDPHMFFMHFWANADAVQLANGLRAAIDKMNVKKG